MLRTLEPSGLTLHNLYEIVQTQLTNTIDNVYPKPSSHSEPFQHHFALPDTVRNKSLETHFVKSKQTNALVNQRT